MTALAVTVPDVPPIVRVAQTYMAATARAAGDVGLQAGYAWDPDGLSASAFGQAVDRGVLRPARLRGVPAWSCGPSIARVRRISCRVTVTSHVWSATIRYSARAGRSVISMTVVAR